MWKPSGRFTTSSGFADVSERPDWTMLEVSATKNLAIAAPISTPGTEMNANCSWVATSRMVCGRTDPTRDDVRRRRGLGLVREPPVGLLPGRVAGLAVAEEEHGGPVHEVAAALEGDDVAGDAGEQILEDGLVVRRAPDLEPGQALFVAEVRQ
jgi:hypothetical protein